MRRLDKVINEFAEIAAFGFGINSNHNDNNSDDYIDYLG